MPVTHSRVAPVVGMLVLIAITAVVFFANYKETPPDSSIRSVSPSAAGSSAQVGAVRSDFRERIEELEKRLEESPGDTAALSDLGRMMLASHRPERAAALFMAWVQADPASGNGWLELARARAELGSWAAALEAMQERLKLGIDDAVGQYNFGAIYANLGDTEQATAWWSRIIDEQADAALVRRAEASIAGLPGSGNE